MKLSIGSLLVVVLSSPICYGTINKQYRTQDFTLQTVLKTYTVHEHTTFTVYSTCTALAGEDVPVCVHSQDARTQRSLLVSAKHPRFVNPSYAVREELVDPNYTPKIDEQNIPQEKEHLQEEVPSEKQVTLVDNIKPEFKLIFVKLTTTITSRITKTKINSATTVGITYSGCVPTDAPVVPMCPTLH